MSCSLDCARWFAAASAATAEPSSARVQSKVRVIRGTAAAPAAAAATAVGGGGITDPATGTAGACRSTGKPFGVCWMPP
jgi:hypothetical protein